MEIPNTDNAEREIRIDRYTFKTREQRDLAEQYISGRLWDGWSLVRSDLRVGVFFFVRVKEKTGRPS